MLKFKKKRQAQMLGYIPLTFITNKVTLPQQNLRSPVLLKTWKHRYIWSCAQLGRKHEALWKLPTPMKLPVDTPSLQIREVVVKSEVKMPAKWRSPSLQGGWAPRSSSISPESSSFSALGSEPCRGCSKSTEGVVANAPSNTSFLYSAPFLGSRKQATSSQSP